MQLGPENFVFIRFSLGSCNFDILLVLRFIHGKIQMKVFKLNRTKLTSSKTYSVIVSVESIISLSRLIKSNMKVLSACGIDSDRWVEHSRLVKSYMGCITPRISVGGKEGL